MSGNFAGVSFRNIFIALGLAAGMLTAAPGFAAEPPGRKAYVEAADQFDRLSAAAVEKGEMPRVTDPVAGPLLKRLSDANAVFGSAAYDKNDIEGILAVCSRTNVFLARYSTVSLSKNHDKEALQKMTPEQLAGVMEDSLQNYQDEAMPLLAFSAECTGRMLPPLTDFARSLKPEELNDVRRQGLAMVRSGAFNSVTGVLIVAKDKGYSEKNRMMVLQAVARNAGLMASAMTPAQREQALQTAIAMRNGIDPWMAQDLSTIILSLSNKECTGLCAL